MTPEQKWERLNNPKTLRDYGLSISEDELRTFPEGRKVLLDMRLAQRRRKHTGSMMARIGAQARLTQARLIADALRGI